MVDAPRPRQDRSRRKREALLRATVEVLSDGGAKSVTHRAVAERAGLPLASTTYYFTSIQELIEEALQLHVAERITEIQGLAAMVASGAASAQDIAERLAEGFVAQPALVLMAQYEMYVAAGRNPALRPAVAEALAAFERLAAAVLAALGARDPEAAAGAFVALLDGFAVHRIARPRPPEEEARSLAAALRSLFLEQVMDPDDRDRLYARLREPLA